MILANTTELSVHVLAGPAPKTPFLSPFQIFLLTFFGFIFRYLVAPALTFTFLAHAIAYYKSDESSIVHPPSHDEERMSIISWLIMLEASNIYIELFTENAAPDPVHKAGALFINLLGLLSALIIWNVSNKEVRLGYPRCPHLGWYLIIWAVIHGFRFSHSAIKANSWLGAASYAGFQLTCNIWITLLDSVFCPKENYSASLLRILRTVNACRAQEAEETREAKRAQEAQKAREVRMARESPEKREAREAHEARQARDAKRVHEEQKAWEEKRALEAEKARDARLKTRIDDEAGNASDVSDEFDEDAYTLTINTPNGPDHHFLSSFSPENPTNHFMARPARPDSVFVPRFPPQPAEVAPIPDYLLDPEWSKPEEVPVPRPKRPKRLSRAVRKARRRSK